MRTAGSAIYSSRFAGPAHFQFTVTISMGSTMPLSVTVWGSEVATCVPAVLALAMRPG